MEEKSGLIIFIAFIIISLLIACLAKQTTELSIIKAKCLKVGVATMTYDISTGNSKFVFDVGESNEK